MRAAAYREVQQRIFDTAWYGTIWYRKYFDGYRKRVRAAPRALLREGLGGVDKVPDLSSLVDARLASYALQRLGRVRANSWR